MSTLPQKKFSISLEQRRYLESCKDWGFSDQSSFVREALDRIIEELEKKKRKKMMEKKAQELFADYSRSKELTVFTELDGEDFL